MGVNGGSSQEAKLELFFETICNKIKIRGNGSNYLFD